MKNKFLQILFQIFALLSLLTFGSLSAFAEKQCPPETYTPDYVPEKGAKNEYLPLAECEWSSKEGRLVPKKKNPKKKLDPTEVSEETVKSSLQNLKKLKPSESDENCIGEACASGRFSSGGSRSDNPKAGLLPSHKSTTTNDPAGADGR